MPCGICPERTWQEGLVMQCGVWVSMTRTGLKLDGLTQSCVEQTQRTVNPFTVDGTYNQSGIIEVELDVDSVVPLIP